MYNLTNGNSGKLTVRGGLLRGNLAREGQKRERE